MEGIAWTRRTGREYGFCAQGRKIVKRCHGTECAVYFYVPKKTLKGSFCYHTHPDKTYPEPSSGDYDYFKYCAVESGCISNLRGDTLCFRGSPTGGIQKPKGSFKRRGRCEANLKLEPLLGPGGYRKLWSAKKRIDPKLSGKYRGRYRSRS